MTARPRRAARSPRARQSAEPPRLAIHDPAALAWGARMIQVALERRRRRLAAAKEGGGHDGA